MKVLTFSGSKLLVFYNNMSILARDVYILWGREKLEMQRRADVVIQSKGDAYLDEQ